VSFFLLSLLDSDPPTLADCAPYGTYGDLRGLKFLKLNIFFLRGVLSSGAPAVVAALCIGDLKGGNIDFLSRFSALADPGSLCSLSFLFRAMPKDGNFFIRSI